MRLLRWLLPLLLISAAVGMTWRGGFWAYAGLVSTLVAGGALVAAALYDVYRADHQRLVSVPRSIRPIQDYGALRGMAYRLMHRASTTAIASAEVSHYADLMAQRLAKQESMASEASSSMSAINAAIMQVSTSATQVVTLAESAQRASHDNHDALADIIQDMTDVAERSGQALAMLTELNDKIERVRSVTSMIEGVAEQTHLLSLNASIEAARAGEHGRGFAVVAGEVRDLALKTSTATQSVDALVKDMHQSGQSVVSTMGGLMTRVRDRAEEMQQVGSSLATITQEFDQVQQEITSVAGAMDSTRAHSQTVADSLDQLEHDVDEGNRHMHALAQQAHALMEAAESVDAELAQQHLEGRHQQVFKVARQTADQIGKLFEKALSRGELSEAALFHPDYAVIPGTQPPLYHTGFDAFTDQ